MVTTNKELEQPAYDSSNWDVPLNANFEAIDVALGDTTSISVAGVPATPVVLTLSQYKPMSIVFSGILSNNVTYQVPSGVGGFWYIYNNTTGAFSVTFDNVAVGTSVVIPQNEARTVVSDGTNIKLADVYGGSSQVLFNNGGNVGGDSDFTFASDVLSVPRINTTTGTAAAPAVRAANDTDTGMFFPAVNQVALSTSATQRFLINASGAIALGSGADFGDTGDVLKSAGNAAEAVWGLAGAVAIANQAASTAFVTFSGLTLTNYKFLVLVFDGVTHSAGASRNFVFGGVSLRPAFAAATGAYGAVFMHIQTGVGMAALGGSGGGSSEATGFMTTYSPASTSVSVSLSGSGTFSGGNLYLLGIS